MGIASLDQLSTPVGELLLLAHLTATDSPSGEMLPEMVDNLREAFRSRDLSALNRFNDLLTDAGYLDAHASEYSNESVLMASADERIGKSRNADRSFMIWRSWG